MESFVLFDGLSLSVISPYWAQLWHNAGLLRDGYHYFHHVLGFAGSFLWAILSLVLLAL